MCASVSKDEGVGCPGIGGAHVQRLGCCGADVPGGVQLEQLVVLTGCVSGLRIAAGKAFVDVIVVND
jgi:hypothetical protein